MFHGIYIYILQLRYSFLNNALFRRLLEYTLQQYTWVAEQPATGRYVPAASKNPSLCIIPEQPSTLCSFTHHPSIAARAAMEALFIIFYNLLYSSPSGASSDQKQACPILILLFAAATAIIIHTKSEAKETR